MIVLAPGVIFNKEKHEYYYRGVKLSGITSKISPVSGYGYMSEEFKALLSETAEEGTYIHEAVEEWIKSGCTVWKTKHPYACFVRDKLLELGNVCLQSETLVSDFKYYASAIDILAHVEDEWIDIFDIKRSFNREYVSWQLSIYKYFVEKYSLFKVRKMGVFASKDKRFFDDIEFKGVEAVERLLYGKTY